MNYCKITMQFINSLQWEDKFAKSSPFILISCLVKMINKTLPQHKVFFRMYVNINTGNAAHQSWHGTGSQYFFKELPQLFFTYLYIF